MFKMLLIGFMAYCPAMFPANAAPVSTPSLLEPSNVNAAPASAPSLPVPSIAHASAATDVKSSAAAQQQKVIIPNELIPNMNAFVVITQGKADRLLAWFRQDPENRKDAVSADGDTLLMILIKFSGYNNGLSEPLNMVEARKVRAALDELLHLNPNVLVNVKKNEYENMNAFKLALRGGYRRRNQEQEEAQQQLIKKIVRMVYEQGAPLEPIQEAAIQLESERRDFHLPVQSDYLIERSQAVLQEIKDIQQEQTEAAAADEALKEMLPKELRGITKDYLHKTPAKPTK